MGDYSYLIGKSLLKLCNILNPQGKWRFKTVPKTNYKTNWNYCNTMKSASCSCLGKDSSGWFIPDEHPIPDIHVVFDVFLDLCYKPGECGHDLRQLLWAMEKHALSRAHSHPNATVTTPLPSSLAGVNPFWWKTTPVFLSGRKKSQSRSSKNIVRALSCWYMLVTNQYGLLDLITQVKFSRIQFLKCLSLTDLDQDSKNKGTKVVT